eukprot:m.1491140 g.1491140  ORF g.1491140 m.1491140 type:complete len:152 (+) comp25191_c0_seq43:2972-3427(+)
MDVFSCMLRASHECLAYGGCCLFRTPGGMAPRCDRCPALVGSQGPTHCRSEEIERVAGGHFGFNAWIEQHGALGETRKRLVALSSHAQPTIHITAMQLRLNMAAHAHPTSNPLYSAFVTRTRHDKDHCVASAAIYTSADTLEARALRERSY